MVDFHTHILPGVDDGADDLDEAMEMLKIAAENGTTDIVLTPHYLTNDMRSSKLSKEQLEQRFKLFSESAKAFYPNINLYMGAEVFGANNIEDVIADNQLITINNTQYVLIEFGFNDQLPRALEICNTLLDNQYIPKIAHPERYSFIQRNPRDIINFLEKGALLQINTSSLAGDLGEMVQDVALSFVENSLVAIIASDCHSTFQRNPDLSEAYSFISSTFSSAYAEDLVHYNPLAILKGKRI